MYQKNKPLRSARYLSWIRSQRCVYSGRTENIIAHHIIDVGMGGCMGGKPSDLFTIPLDGEVHQMLHLNGINIDQKSEALKMIAKAVNDGVLVIS